MFAPHHTENAQLSDVWVSPENLLNACVFFARYAVLRSDLWSDSNFVASGGHISILQRRAETAGHDIARPGKNQNRLDQSRGATDHAVALAAPTSVSTMERKITRPSEEPRADSTARSGWGMRPTTLRSRLQTPAILSTAPLGLPALSSEPSGDRKSTRLNSSHMSISYAVF